VFTKNGIASAILVTMLALSAMLEGCTNRNAQMRQQGAQTQQQGTQQQGTQQQGTRIMGQNPGQDNVNERIQVANQAADKIVQINGVARAYVLVTQRNAYVAATLHPNQQLSSDMEKRIADQVRATVPHVQNVYVSTNPDFVNRVSAYVNDVQQGRPVAGFVEQFNEMVQRIFPNPR
jgi:YhcN/YlaJ family sporulation lipoprotein